MESLTALKQLGELCIICEQSKDTGIHLYTSFVCTDCEKEMISTDTNDPHYKHFVEKLRKVNRPEIFS